MTRMGRRLAAGIGIGLIPVLGAWADSVHVAPDHISSGKTAWILVRATPGVKVHAEAVSGTECGTIDGPDQTTNPQGEAKFVFTATADPPVTCRCRWKVMIGRAADGQALTDANSALMIKEITVDPAEPLGLNTVDATTALTIILIASFAIDRIVKLLMMLIPLGPAGKTETAQRERLIYIALAACMGLLLGYFGKIRLLSGLGFSTSIALNVLVTALILTAGSDAISVLIKKMGGSSPGEPEAKPLVVQGDLTLRREEKGGRNP